MLPTLDIFGWQLPMYGGSIAVGIIACYILAGFVGKRTKIGDDLATTMVFAAIFGAFVGAQILAFIVEGEGDASQGGVYLGAYGFIVVATVATAAWKKAPKLIALDVITPVVSIAHGFGRLGCLFAGCCYGVPTDHAVGFQFAKDSIAYQTFAYHKQLDHMAGEMTVPLVPTQLFEAIFEFGLCGLFVLLIIKKARPGLVFFLYCLLYSGFRFVIEYYRFDPERGYVIEGVISTSQFLSLLMFLSGLFGMWWLRRAAPGTDRRAQGAGA